MRSRTVSINLVAFYLAIGNVVWFAHFILGSLKLGLLALILLSTLGLFLNRRNYVGLGWFLLLLPFLLIALSKSTLQGAEGFDWLKGFFENYIFLFLGYAFLREGYDTQRLLRYIPLVTCTLCALIVSNFFFGFPNWTSPIAAEAYRKAVAGGYMQAELVTMNSSGFGLGRTGWATTLASYLPLTLFFVHKKKVFLLGYVLIALAILLSASRGGLLLLLTITTVLFMKSDMSKSKKVVYLCCLALVAVSTLSYLNDLERFLRLSGG